MTSWARVRFTVAAVVVGALLAGVWLIPSVASADKQTAVHRGTTYSDEDCQALKELDDEIPDVSAKSSDIYGKRAAAISTGFSETADKVENKKLKKALNTLADYWDQLSDADNLIGAVKVTAKLAKTYGKAAATWTKALVSCATASVTIPSITLPSGVTLPNGVTLPGNITLPTAPR